MKFIMTVKPSSRSSAMKKAEGGKGRESATMRKTSRLLLYQPYKGACDRSVSLKQLARFRLRAARYYSEPRNRTYEHLAKNPNSLSHDRYGREHGTEEYGHAYYAGEQELHVGRPGALSRGFCHAGRRL